MDILGDYLLNELSRSKRKILIIEDDRDLMEELSLILQFEHYDVVQAVNGAEGLTLMKTEKPDLVLCDIVMRGIDGFEVLRQFRENAANSFIPFVFITAVTAQKKIRQSMEMGADEYLVKPFSRIELLETIKTQLRKHEEQRNQIRQLKSSIAFCISKEVKPSLHKLISDGRMIKHFSDMMSEKDIVKAGSSIYINGLLLEDLIDKLLILIDLEAQKMNFSARKSTVSSEKTTELAGRVADNFDRRSDLIVELSEIILKGSKKWFLIAFNELVTNAFNSSGQGQKVIISTVKNKENLILSVCVDESLTDACNHKVINYEIKSGETSKKPEDFGFSIMLIGKIISLYKGELYISTCQDKIVSTLIKLPI
jgi:two-component system, sensor histidine kinase and response regulator